MTHDKTTPAPTELNDDELQNVSGGDYLTITLQNAKGDPDLKRAKRRALDAAPTNIAGGGLGSGR